MRFKLAVILLVFQFESVGLAQSAKRVKLSVENPSSVERKSWPITQGIPFADGELERGAPVRVIDSDGKALATAEAIGTTSFFVGTDITTDERQALPLATEDLATRLVSQLSEGW